MCSHGQYRPERDDLLVAPGDVKLWVSPQRLLVYRVGLIGGNATGVLTVDELRQAAEDATRGVKQLTIDDGATTLPVIDQPVAQQPREQARDRSYDLGGGQVQLRTITAIERTTLIDMSSFRQFLRLGEIGFRLGRATHRLQQLRAILVKVGTAGL